MCGRVRRAGGRVRRAGGRVRRVGGRVRRAGGRVRRAGGRLRRAGGRVRRCVRSGPQVCAGGSAGVCGRVRGAGALDREPTRRS